MGFLSIEKNTSVRFLLIIYTAATLYALFVVTGLRDQLEKQFFDWKTSLLPDQNFQDLVLIDIADASRLIPNYSPGEYSFTPKIIENVIQKILAGTPKKVAILLPSHDVAYTKALQDLLLTYSNDVSYGLFGLEQHLEHLDTRTKERYLKDPFYPADTARDYGADTVRSLPVMVPFHEFLQAHLTVAVAHKVTGRHWHFYHKEDHKTSVFDQWAGSSKMFSKFFTIRYSRPSTIERFSYQQYLEDNNVIKDKVVWVGMTGAERSSDSHPEGINVDLQKNQRASLLSTLALSYHNIVTDSWIRPTPFYYNILQITLWVILWIFSMKCALRISLLIMASGVLTLIATHVFIMAAFSYWLPVADVFFVLTTLFVCTAFLATDHHAKKQTTLRAKEKLGSEILEHQSQFLSDFTSELMMASKKIKSWAKSSLEGIDGFCAGPKQLEILKRLNLSSEDLSNFLQSAHQYNLVNDNNVMSTQIDAINLQDMMSDTITKFEQSIESKNLKVVLSGDPKLVLHNDKVLTGAIVFNIISNAVKFSPVKGLITIKWHSDHGLFRLEICDEGPGFKLTADETPDLHSSSITGYGLGLSLSTFFARRIGAEIESKLLTPKGSKLSLTFGAL